MPERGDQTGAENRATRERERERQRQRGKQVVGLCAPALRRSVSF